VAKEDAGRFDSGWLATQSLAGLEAALTNVPDWRFDRGAEMADRCRAVLREHFEVVGDGAGTLVSFVPPGDPAEDVARLYEAGVVVRDLPNTGWVRASCGWWTNDEDIERLVATLVDAS
jgi:selenocysteine lyase/cysteine desulfurase